MKTPKIILALAMLAVSTLGACTTATNEIIDSHWDLLYLNNLSVPAIAPITLNFANNNINGTNGCNNYGSAYTIEGDKLTISKNIASTLIACSDPLKKQAAAYLAAITKAARYQIVGQQLTLFDENDKALASFIKQSSDLNGITWHTTGYNNSKFAVMSILIGSNISINFSNDGKLGGLAGCNTYTANYELADKKINISAITTTHSTCAEPAGVMAQEANYIKALEMTTTYRLEGDQLELHTSSGAIAATFIRMGMAINQPMAMSLTHVDNATEILPIRPPQPSLSVLETLRNAEYPIKQTKTGIVQLKDGSYEGTVTFGSAAKIKVQLGKEQAFGDINGDGIEDAVVLLMITSDGNDTLTTLTGVINKDGVATPMYSILLGDHILVQSITIRSGTIFAVISPYQPNIPTATASIPIVTRAFKLQNNKLIEIVK